MKKYKFVVEFETDENISKGDILRGWLYNDDFLGVVVTTQLKEIKKIKKIKV